MADNKMVRMFVFGDQTYNVADALQRLVRERNDPLVTDFLERSSGTLKHEISRLSPGQQDQCPRFASVAELLPYYCAGSLNPALVQALTCIAHFAAFLREQGRGSQPYPSANSSCVVGVCTGTLAAAAVSCAVSTSHLLPLALHTVAVALRLGSLAWDVGARLSGDDGSHSNPDAHFPSWATAIAGIGVSELQEKLQQFAAERALPLPTSPYLSAVVGAAHASVSGPPAAVSAFITSISKTTTLTTPPISLRVTAPYHAPHLYSEDDISRLLNGLDSGAGWPTARIPIISASRSTQDTGGDLAGLTLPAALAEALRDCLIRRIAIDVLPSRIAGHMNSCGHTQVSHQLHAVTNGDRIGPAVRSLLEPRAAGIAEDTPSPSVPPAVLGGPMGSHGSRSNTPIAILSVAGRFPHADDMDAFWEVLLNGVDTHEMVPASRWNASSHVHSDPKTKNVSGTGFGCWLHNAGKFDAQFFNMSPREAPQVDPAQRLALLTAAEALERAGIVPDRTPSTQKNRVGVYFGSTSNDWMETNSAQNIDAYFIPGGNRAFIPGRINYHFKFSGPSYTIDTACSSSLAALHMACNALWKGEVDTAIVGGSNVLTNPDMTAGLDKGHFLSRTGNCKTFDDGADGYCRGEAVCTLVLKRLGDAIIDKDPIQASILGVSTNHNAEAESITRPHVGAQQELFQRLLAESGVSANDISYVEMHGTGTQAGDAGEATSVVHTLSPLTSRGSSVRPVTNPLHIGAAKANVGHGEAAAGVTSLAKVLLMLKHSKIPPHTGIKTKINHKLPDIQARNTYIAKKAIQWSRPVHGKRRVLLNNFSAAGGNTAIVLEDAPFCTQSDEPDARLQHVVTVSAKTPDALISNLRNLIQWIDDQAPSALTLARLSYTTTARRMHHRHRIAVTGANLSQIRAALQERLDQRDAGEKSIPVPPKSPGVVFAFTGQGSPYPGMGYEMYKYFDSFRADIIRYDQLCTQMDLPPIRKLFEEHGAFATATQTMIQLSHTCLQMALYNLWRSFGIAPKAVVGHSLGEYAALYAGGALSQVDVLYLVGKRAQLMEKHLTPGTHAMLVARASEAAVVAALPFSPLGEEYGLACRNGEQNVVLGGTTAQMNEARTILERKGMRCQYLDTPFAFHTAQVDPILQRFSSIAGGAQFHKPQIPVISPTYGKVLREVTDIQPDYFTEHCRTSVNMSDALRIAKGEGLFDGQCIALEIGPAQVVTPMIKEVVGSSAQTFAPLQRNKDTWKLLTHTLSQLYMSGAQVAWDRYHHSFPGCQQVLDLPVYGWSLKEYWMQYVHDWSLRKGDPPLVMKAFILESSSIHTIVQNKLNGEQDGELIIDSDLSRKDLHPMVQGHKVYGVPLCTPSVYADIALTIGNYIMGNASLGGQKTVVDVGEMNIQSALVANNTDKQQLLRTKFEAKNKVGFVTFSSVDSNGKVIEQHANCKIRFADIEASMKDTEEKAAHARARIDALRTEVGEGGNTYRFGKDMIYKMVGQLADFDPKYRGLVAITLNNDTLEAAGTVSFKGIANDGKWFESPAYLDALSQLGGFVMNANSSVDLDKELFVNHGWGSLKLFTKLDSSKSYYTYVQMKPGEDKLYTGDVLIFDENKVLVGVVGGVALQGVPKRLMSYIVHAANKKVSGTAQSATAQSSKPSASVHRRPQMQRATADVQMVLASKEVKAVELTTKPAESAILEQAMKIVSEEIGITLSALTDDVEFADAGLDSLLALVISSRMRDELEIDFESSQFLEVGSIGGLKQFLKKYPSEEAVVITETATTEQIVPLEQAVLMMEGEDLGQTWPAALKIVSEESGIVEKDLTDDVAFADAGVDSLMSLVICSRLRDELDIDFPDRALFEECQTVLDLRMRLTVSSDSSPSESSVETPPSSPALFSPVKTLSMDSVSATPLTAFGDSDEDFPVAPKKQALAPIPSAVVVPSAWSVYLQGSRKRCTETLFLFPDGCGAATSYLSLPIISATTAVVGFNSPFMKKPQEMYNHSLSDVLQSYLAGLRDRQPHGPYHLGGWSAGGILAYAIAQELLAAGEEVATITLIDSPPPNKGLDRLPDRFFDHCNNVGLFGVEMQRGSAATKVPDWLMPHFRASIELLHDYHAPPMRAAAIQKTKVTIVWAGECAFDGVRYDHLPSATDGDDDTEGMKFLTERRQDRGPGEWADLFPGVKIGTHTVEGEQHFSMMRDRGAQKLVEIVREVLSK
ncbi:Non-reducing polyketide synthase ctb1 [Vermiconidia calcicola]|uniref:Non-reducing polyketide synthase ctb1 n=1 Tax=Vermiconidia calcicola TaxID=1690605 RepID=A0ACC3NB93_9PEZI|nr:Non-reducing polyketide synthase ctb1 [Vermiconidia calcicola]